MDELFPPDERVIVPVELLVIVPAPAIEATVSVLPFISKIAPDAITSALLFDIRSFAAPNCREPALTVVAPV